MSEKKTHVFALVRRAIRLHRQIEELKDTYKKMDAVTEKLVEMGFKTAVEGRYEVMLVDNFAEKNTSFKAVGIRRFELKIVPVNKPGTSS